MATYFQRVASTMLSVNAFEQQLLADLDEVEGGNQWWKGQLEPWANILLFDYTLAAVAAVQEALTQAAYHEEQYGQKAYAAQHRFRTASMAAQAAGRPFEFGPELRLDETAVELSINVSGFFRAIVSALDNLAATMCVVVGADGLIQRRGMSSMFADFNGRKRRAKVMRAVGRGQELQETYAAEAIRVVSGDAPGWLDWTLRTRNALMHRPPALQWVLGQESKREVFDLVRPLARQPELGPLESMTTGGLVDAVLQEDAQVTLQGVMDSSLTVATGRRPYLSSCGQSAATNLI